MIILNKLTKLLSISILGLVLSLGLALAQTDTGIVTSLVSASTLIDISPNTFTFNGAVGSTVLGNNSAEIENIGSTNISQLTFDTTTGNASPWATGNAVNYSVGAYLSISNDNASNTFNYINYQDWNQTAPVYVVNPTNTVASGRFRFGAQEFFWAVQNGNGSVTTGAACNNGTVYLANTSGEVHNRTQIGGVDLSGKTGIVLTSTITPTNATPNNAWGMTDVSITGLSSPFPSPANYCFAIAGNCSTVYLIKHNQVAYPFDNVTACANDIAFLNVTDQMKPGNLTRAYFALSIPFGTANGTIAQTVVTVRATD